MTVPTYLGIDVGTSVAKAALFDAAGDAVAVAGRPLPLSHPGPDQVEQDQDLVLQRVAEVVAEVRASAGSSGPDLVAVTGQGDGCWLVDADSRPVRPAVSWLDGRADDLLRQWQRNGVADAVFRINGNTLFPGSQALILPWLHEHEPELLDRAATAAYCKDVVFGRLTGVRATDGSDASLPFGDGTGTGYSAPAIALCGLEHRAGLLAPVVQGLPRSEVSPAGAAELGLPAGTPVVDGPFDFPACAIGSGITTPGDGLMIVGTTLGCQVLVERLDLDGPATGMHLATPEPGRWLRAMPAMSGTASLDWLLRMLGLPPTEVDGALRRTAPGAGGVEMLPYLAPSGERAPFLDAAARGQFTGLALATSRDDLIRAVCEGLAYAARECFEAAGLTGRIVVSGGGARSVPWLEVFANVLERPLQVARAGEVGARGAVLAALAATGRTVDTAAWTAPDAVVEPDPATAERYRDGYARYLQHRAAAAPLWVRQQEPRSTTEGPA